MHLKAIELYGFKSFADRTKIEFNGGTSVIVGPNGSGKSNVSDAIRWVLGEQSAKSLRGNKMEDIIFAGTKKRRPVGMAEISLILDNNDGALPLEFTEVRVTRRVYRSGDGEYLLNGKNCRLKDILRLFADTGIGLDGYAIIGQGKISEMLMAKPEERRSLIEETAGIVKYRERKKEATRKLSDAEQNILRVGDIILEIEGRLEPLSAESNKAKEYLVYKEELDKLSISMALKQYKDSVAKVDDFKAKKVDIQNNEIQLTNLISQHEIKLINDKNKESLINEEIAKKQSLYYEKANLIEKTEGEIKALDSQKNGNEEKCVLFNNQLKSTNEKLTCNDAEIEQLNNDLSILKDEVEAIRLVVNILEEKRQNEVNIIDEQMKKLELMRNDAFELARLLSNKRNDLTIAESSKENMAKELNSLNGKLEILAAEKEKLVAKINEIKNNISQTIEDKQVIADEILKVSDSASKLDNMIKSLLNYGGKLAENRSKLEARYQVLKNMSNSYEGYYPGVRSILKAKKNGKFNGLLGIVAELIDVYKKYTVAIESVLGGALQNLVTTNSSVARDAVAYLKRERAGQATFLPIDMLKVQAKPNLSGDITNHEGFIGIASDLVNCDTDVRSAIDFLLNKTAIVDTLDNAIKLSKIDKSRLRFITLDGDIINAGGSITGGSRDNKKSQVLSRLNEISELEKEIAVIRDKEEELRVKVMLHNEEYANLSDKLVKLNNKQQDLSMIHTELISDMKNIEDRINYFNKEIEVLQLDKSAIMDNNSGEDIGELVSEIDSIKAQEESLLVDISTTEQNISNLRHKDKEEIDSLNGNRIKLSGLEKDYEVKTGELNRLTNENKQLSEDSKSISLTIDNLYKAIMSIELDVIAKREFVDDIAKELIAMDKDIKIRTADKNSLHDEIIALEDELKKLSRDKDKFKDSLYQIDLKIERVLAEIDQVRENVLENYELSIDELGQEYDDDRTLGEMKVRGIELKSAVNGLGSVNIGSIEEFVEVSERYAFLSEQRDDILKAKDELLQVIADMDTIIEKTFMETFEKINDSFKITFPEFFQGGSGELRLTKPENLLETGVDIIVQPPGKRLQHHGLLSGGEKSLCGIALLFAILKVKPCPFYVLDEIDAALDDANVNRFASYMEKFSSDSQFIIITHRQGTMSAARDMYGVTMEEDGVSKIVSVKLVS